MSLNEPSEPQLNQNPLEIACVEDGTELIEEKAGYDSIKSDRVEMQAESHVNSNLTETPVISTIMTAVSHGIALNGSSNSITSSNAIFITDHGIVFPPGALMLSDGESPQLGDNADESNGNTEFDIKVESNMCEHDGAVHDKRSSVGECADNSKDENSDPPVTPIELSHGGFQLSQLLQGLADSDGTLAQFSFGGEHFSVPIHHLSSADLRSLAKVTCNVLMSAAALPEDAKGEDGSSIVIDTGDQKFLMLKQSGADFISHISSGSGLEVIDTKHVVLPDDKEYLVSDLSPDMFIKSECSTSIQGNPQDSSALKSESIINSTAGHVPSIVPSTSQHQVTFCLQVEPGVSRNPVYLNAGSLSKSVSSPFILPAVHTQSPLTDTFEIKSKRGSGRSSRRAAGPIALVDKPKAPLRALAPRIFVPTTNLVRSSAPHVENSETTAMDRLVSSLRSSSLPESMQPSGNYFEALGRCVQCFRFSRTTAYCRAEKRHRDTKASPCLECEQTGRSTVVCRRKLNHKTPNALPVNLVINTAMQREEDIKALCLRNMLPECFSELQSIVVHHADICFATGKLKDDSSDNEFSSVQDSPVAIRKPTDYARGYLYPYSKEVWNSWLLKFCCQTGTNYRIRTGKRVNKKSDHGLANHNGRVVVYRTIETQLYNCALGGKPRKRKLKDGVKRRKERGSKLVGCPAVIHTRLIETENHWCALEVTVPKLSSHLVSHDPRSADGELPVDSTQVQMFHQGMCDASLSSTPEPVNRSSVLQLELVERLGSQQHLVDSKPFQSMSKASLAEQRRQLNDDVTVNALLKKQTKNVFLSCANVLGNVNNTELLQAVHDYAQVLYNQLLKASLTGAPPPAKRSRLMKPSLVPTASADEHEAVHQHRMSLLPDS